VDEKFDELCSDEDLMRMSHGFGVKNIDKIVVFFVIVCGEYSRFHNCGEFRDRILRRSLNGKSMNFLVNSRTSHNLQSKLHHVTSSTIIPLKTKPTTSTT
jgi:hypothetical protein